MTSLKYSQNLLAFSIFGILILSLLLPTFVLAREATAPAGGTGITYECENAECDFQDLLNAVKRATDFMVRFSLAFSVVAIAYAGYSYMISGANPSERQQANKRLRNLAIGIFFILAAWLIISLILGALRVETVVEFK